MVNWHVVGASAIGAIALAAFGTGCSADGSEQTNPDPATGTARSQIIGGTPTGDHPEVSFTLAGGGIGGFIANGAVLLSPTLAITQIQAVSKDIFFPPSTQGTIVPCGTVSGLFDPSEITLYAGDGKTSETQAIDNGVVGTSSVAKQIITNGEVDTCKGPFAFIILASPINTITTFPQLELDNLPAVNDSVLQCAWGDTDTTCLIGDQKSCESGTITLPNGGYYAPNQIQFQPGQILTTGNDCYDTAGAIYDGKGALLALMNLGIFAPDAKSTLSDPCKSCVGDITEGILLSSQADLVARAFKAAGSSPWRAGHPKPADVGGVCADALDCNSQFCVQVGAQGYCSQDCSTTACPGTTVCAKVNDQNICLPAVTPHPSCSVNEGVAMSADDGDSRTWGLVGLIFAGLVGARSRSKAKGSKAARKAR